MGMRRGLARARSGGLGARRRLSQEEARAERILRINYELVTAGAERVALDRGPWPLWIAFFLIGLFLGVRRGA